jgi:hypothetical protein
VLFELEPDYSVLRRQVAAAFSSRTVGVEDVERFVIQETAFLPSHYKRHVLARMETAVPPQIEAVTSGPGRRRGTFPPRTQIRFGS